MLLDSNKKILFLLLVKVFWGRGNKPLRINNLKCDTGKSKFSLYSVLVVKIDPAFEPVRKLIPDFYA